MTGVGIFQGVWFDVGGVGPFCITAVQHSLGLERLTREALTWTNVGCDSYIFFRITAA
jgi:hypothetical protein